MIFSMKISEMPVYRIMDKGKDDPTSFFALNCFLQARIDTGYDTKGDEDVNMHMCGVLTEDLLGRYPRGRSMEETGIRRSGIDIQHMVDNEPRTYVRFNILRKNADARILDDGIHHTGDFTGNGDTYYSCAASLALERGKRSVADVLGKISNRYPTYVSVLDYMRGEYLKLFGCLSDGEMFHLQRQTQQGAAPGIARIGRDAFLDAYSDWKNTGNEGAKERVAHLAAELEKVDPAFHFPGLE